MLRLTRSGIPLDTMPIPFDAVALGSDELPADNSLSSFVTCENDAGTNDETCDGDRLVRSGSMQMKVSVTA